MEELKSVRLRKSNIKSGNLDIKVTVYNNSDTNEIIINGTNNSRIVWKEVRYSKIGIYSNMSTSDFINLFITTNNKLDGNSESTNYTIIQDPWSVTPPVIRNYGFDPYYLNNGAQVFIEWNNNGFTSGGTKFSDDYGNELFDPSITKTFYIIHKDITYMLSIDSNNNFIRKADSKEYNVKDENILQDIISYWKNKVFNYDLNICNPNNESCYIIEFKDPTAQATQEINPITKVSDSVKEKLTVTLQSDTVKAKIDITSFNIYVGKPKDNTSGETNTSEDNYIMEDEDILSQYTETEFSGLDEVELELQDDISNYQEDSDNNIGMAGSPANIQPVGSLDSLLRLAGDCARELGKNPRVNYRNLSSGFIKGVHGLCPQGTLSVLYALTGVKSLGTIRGNADTFSMKGSNSFPGSYFNSKIRVGKDYFNDGSMWQIGDIIAVGYLEGRPYGHIQIWTGVKWVSDFTQNRLQVNHIDWNTVALHRMNTNGVEAVRKQTLYV